MDAVLAFLGTVRPDQVALGALVTFGVISVLRGWVVPRSVLTDRMKDAKDHVVELGTERDDWKSAFHAQSEENQILLKQNTDLIESGQVANRVLETLRQQVEWNQSHPRGEGR